MRNAGRGRGCSRCPGNAGPSPRQRRRPWRGAARPDRAEVRAEHRPGCVRPPGSAVSLLRALGSRLRPAPSPDPPPRSPHGRGLPEPGALWRPSASPGRAGGGRAAPLSHSRKAPGAMGTVSVRLHRRLLTGGSFCYSLNRGLLLSAAKICNNSGNQDEIISVCTWFLLRQPGRAIYCTFLTPAILHGNLIFT